MVKSSTYITWGHGFESCHIMTLLTSCWLPPKSCTYKNKMSLVSSSPHENTTSPTPSSLILIKSKKYASWSPHQPSRRICQSLAQLEQINPLLWWQIICFLPPHHLPSSLSKTKVFASLSLHQPSRVFTPIHLQDNSKVLALLNCKIGKETRSNKTTLLDPQYYASNLHTINTHPLSRIQNYSSFFT